MKRGLKVLQERAHMEWERVTTIAPMKRGLKEFMGDGNPIDPFGYNHCPDEKGTESSTPPPMTLALPRVTTIAPMKRGLKAGEMADMLAIVWSVTTIAPMKRGLKAHSHRRCRWERRVTTIAPMKRGLKERDHHGHLCTRSSYNHCPDEKGTERDKVWYCRVRFVRLQPLPR